MSQLTELPNIGKTLAEKLEEAGIHTAEELKAAGAEQAFLRIRAFYPDACLSMLSALEGAVQGIRWHLISKERKEELKHFLKQLQLM